MKSEVSQYLKLLGSIAIIQITASIAIPILNGIIPGMNVTRPNLWLLIVGIACLVLIGIMIYGITCKTESKRASKTGTKGSKTDKIKELTDELQWKYLEKINPDCKSDGTRYLKEKIDNTFQIIYGLALAKNEPAK